MIKWSIDKKSKNFDWYYIEYIDIGKIVFIDEEYLEKRENDNYSITYTETPIGTYEIRGNNG